MIKLTNENAKVAIIIVNWNGQGLLNELFCSLGCISYKNYFVIVVDNGSADDSIKYLKTNYPDTVIIANEENLGFAEGNNIGARLAIEMDAEYILFLNNDTTMDPQFVSELIAVAQQDQRIGIVAPKIYYADKPDKIWSLGGKRKKFYDFAHIGQGEIDQGLPSEPKQVEWVSGCALMIRRETFEITNGFDPDYYMYVEDVDLCYRVRNAGYLIFVVPRSVIWHKISASYNKGIKSPIRKYYMTRNSFLFVKKNHSFRNYVFGFYFFTKTLVKIIAMVITDTELSCSMLRGFRDSVTGKTGKV